MGQDLHAFFMNLLLDIVDQIQRWRQQRHNMISDIHLASYEMLNNCMPKMHK